MKFKLDEMFILSRALSNLYELLDRKINNVTDNQQRRVYRNKQKTIIKIAEKLSK